MIDDLIRFLYFVLGLLAMMFVRHIESLLKISQDKKLLKNSNEIDAFERMLASHHNLLLTTTGFKDDEDTTGFQEHLKMLDKLLIWSNDDVLSEYGAYMENVDPEQASKISEREIHFANAVLAFRKQRKHKNKKISPQLIALLFKGGFKDVI